MNEVPKSNTKIISEKEVRTTTNPDGTEQTTMVEKTKAFERSTEPDYIKLYTKMWCEFNGIAVQWRPLFLELVTRMSYANTTELETSQTVYTGEPFASAICKSLGWTQKDSLMKGLRALVKCGAIRKVSRAVYQINPSYAGRGEWKYNPRYNRGGVEDLVATFNFKAGTVQTTIVWADDSQDTDINHMYRAMLDTSPTKHDRAILKTTETKPDGLEPPPEGEPPEE